MTSSYSFEAWHAEKINTELLLQEIKLSKGNTFDYNLLTEREKIDKWVENVSIWRRDNLHHNHDHRSLIGIKGEMFAALIFCNHNFEEWLKTAAVRGYGNNTNMDLKTEWTKFKGNVEVKTINGSSNKVIINTPKSKKFEYPEYLLVVLYLGNNKYKLHSITDKDTLKKIDRKYYTLSMHCQHWFMVDSLRCITF